ncbi:cell division protein FtsQ [Steroidobacter denitrificans]|uniref:Cell division protein FtsQ n=1 Tax=Steroidobacter denitrificans TaxID=465721 RepID=A0A127F5X9_STEDE|nr:cell division protein FtsQ/DivIB [Steroidobacter denitrificans]AMN45844.1 cell division protein FtsQ [Steroidobacter denitrificans]
MVFNLSFRRNRSNRRKPAGAGWAFPPAWLKALFVGGFRTVLGAGALAGGLAVMVWGLLVLLDRPIGTVEAGGQFQRVAPVQIEEAVAPFRGTGFLSVDLDAMRAAIEGIPWVDRARIERRWPHGVGVFITEHVPAARWGDDGLMNTRGELFLRGVRHMPPELPLLDGPQGTETQVAKLYLESYPRLLEVGLRLSKVELDARGAWELTLSNGVRVRLGRQAVQARLERFIEVASPMLAARGGEVAYVDLRYSNGFSVGWNASTRVGRDAEDYAPDV